VSKSGAPAVGKGRTLTEDINRLASRTGQIRNDLNKRVLNMADDINRLTDQIGKLNVRIAETEGGDVSQSDAVGLRDQRNVALSDLSKLIDIRVQEQSSGAVAVFVGGDFLVYNGTVRQVKVELTTDRGLNVGNLRLADSDAPLLADSGELSGLIKSRDDILGGYLDNLDSFAKTLAFEFNKIYSSGQGLKGYTELTSERSVDSAAHALDAAGLPFTPVNGSFQIQVYNKDTKLTRRRTLAST
jgi:flagellar hook-associated protein 1 FlgK